MNIKQMPIDELLRYENNPRDNAKAVEYVANSIAEFGFKVPIIIDCNNIIVAGDTRYQAAKRLKLKEVPCIIADDLTDQQVKAFRLADNKVSEFSKWNVDKLEDELQQLLETDMLGFGFEAMAEELEKESTKDLSDSLKETYECIIECTDEINLQETYDKMTEEGYKCRILIL